MDIVYPDFKDGVAEEMVFRIQGFILSAQLPPYMRSLRSVKHNVVETGLLTTSVLALAGKFSNPDSR